MVAKGHNVTYDVINPLKHTISATDDTGIHVPENGGTCHFAFCNLVARRVQSPKNYFLLLFIAIKFCATKMSL
jgi:hypothetical protein